MLDSQRRTRPGEQTPFNAVVLIVVLMVGEERGGGYDGEVMVVL